MRSSLLKGADGMILVDVALGADEVAVLLDHGGPAVTVGLEFEGIPSVVVDDLAIGHMATTHLLALGHTEIALLAGAADDPLGFTVPEQRRVGYHRALGDAGVGRRPELEANGNFSLSGAHEAMTALLALERPPTAVFSMSDEMAFGALKAIRDQGLRVPEDVSIIGVDDHPFAWVEDLTTVQQQVGDHGSLAAQLVLDKIDGYDGRTRVVAQPSIVIRNSTARRRETGADA